MNTDIQNFTDALLFADGILKLKKNIEIIKFDAINGFSSALMRLYNSEKSKLPYHINILDLLWANENAHSRIFAHLLKQKSGNTYNILDSFLEYLAELNPHFNHSVHKPKITTETGRIDLLILDKGYAIIVENKIHDAADQSSQIARYIEKILNEGYKSSQIFVVYLTRDGNKTPEDQSWKLYNINYKEDFADRFFPLSFKEDILPLLKDTILPNCKVKDVYLKSAIEQYIDHLEGMFNQRKIHHKMNSELHNHIKEVLQLNGSPEQNHPILKNKLDELVKVTDQVRDLLKSFEKECWAEWHRRLKLEFPGYVIIDRSDVERFKKVGIVMEANGIKFCALIEYDNNTIYYGLSRHENDNELNKDIKSILKPCLVGLKESPYWYGWKNTSFQNGYMRLKNFIEEVQKQLATNNKTSLMSNN